MVNWTHLWCKHTLLAIMQHDPEWPRVLHTNMAFWNSVLLHCADEYNKWHIVIDRPTVTLFQNGLLCCSRWASQLCIPVVTCPNTTLLPSTSVFGLSMCQVDVNTWKWIFTACSCIHHGERIGSRLPSMPCLCRTDDGHQGGGASITTHGMLPVVRWHTSGLQWRLCQWRQPPCQSPLTVLPLMQESVLWPPSHTTLWWWWRNLSPDGACGVCPSGTCL